MEGEFGRVGEKAAGRGDEPGNGEEAMAADGGKVIEIWLGAEIRDDSRREKGDSSRGSANPIESVVVSKIQRSRKSQGGEGGRKTSRQTRLRGKRLVKGDIIRRHVWYERRKLFIKVMRGRRYGWQWVRVGKDGSCRGHVPQADGGDGGEGGRM